MKKITLGAMVALMIVPMAEQSTAGPRVRESASTNKANTPSPAKNIVTLYCDVTERVDDKPPEPIEQRIFTINYRSKQIYVVQGRRRTGEVLLAKAITDGGIEFPDIEPGPESVAFRGATERIDRLTGNYTYEESLASGFLRVDAHVSGVCQKGNLIPIPAGKF